MTQALLKLFPKYAIVLVLVFTFLIYLPTLQHNFIWDDGYFITGWEQVRQPLASMKELIAGQSPMSNGLVYRPLRSLLYALSIHYYAADPFWYHLQAIVVHTAITFLVYLNAKLLFKKPSIALIAATFFGIHPIHTEAVTWITASFDTIGSLFFFASFYLYQLGSQTGASINFKKISWILALLAVFTYELTLSILPIFILYDYLIHPSKKFLKNFIPSYKYWLLLPVLYFTIKLTLTSSITGSLPYIFSRLPALTIFPIMLLGKYILLLLLPLNQSINHHIVGPVTNLYYFQETALQTTQQFVFNLSILAAIAAALAWIGAAFFLYKKSYPVLAFLVAFTCIALIPVLQFIPLTSVFAEKYTYMASFGVVSLMAYLVYLLISFQKQVGLVVLGVIIIGLSLLTYNRNQVWAEPLIFWQTASEQSIPNAYIYRQIAASYFMADEIDQAITYYLLSLELEPNNERALINLGFLYSQKQQYQLAIQTYKQALEISPNNAEVIQLIAQAYLNMDQLERVQTKVTEIIENIPGIDTSRDLIEQLKHRFNLFNP